MTARTIDEPLRATLARLADALLASAADLPLPSSIGIQHEWLDRVLSARPDLETPLRTVLERAGDRDPREEAARLAREDARSYLVLATVVAGAYYMHPAVRAAIGYPGQTPRLAADDPDDEAMTEELLRPVRERGPIYRR